ncbi:hypothetical protein GPJ56_004096 [Histomonas meleagridis]|nr:hypothetical protein GPJ56_004096 [Histomonas meleagridis]
MTSDTRQWRCTQVALRWWRTRRVVALQCVQHSGACRQAVAYSRRWRSRQENQAGDESQAAGGPGRWSAQAGDSGGGGVWHPCGGTGVCVAAQCSVAPSAVVAASAGEHPVLMVSRQETSVAWWHAQVRGACETRWWRSSGVRAQDLQCSRSAETQVRGNSASVAAQWSGTGSETQAGARGAADGPGQVEHPGQGHPVCVSTQVCGNPCETGAW